MNKYIIAGILLFALTITIGYAQSNTSEAHYKSGPVELNKFLNKQFSLEAKKYNIDTCIVSTVFAKFTVDSIGNIKHISFSAFKGTPQIFETILSSVIMATNGSWIPGKTEGKMVESQPFILPLVYSMEAGCGPSRVQANGTYKPVPNGLETALLGVLDFEDNVGTNPTQLDCIILRPLYIFSQR